MVIRNHAPSEAESICLIFQSAFSGPPWNERFSMAVLLKQWADHSQKPGFRCLVAENEGELIGATWWDTPTLAQLETERGKALAAMSAGMNPGTIVWLRETCVDRSFHRRGVARRLKQESLRAISCYPKPVLLLTRMRDDNAGIVRINSSMGLKRTNITTPSKTFPGVVHEYWYRLLDDDVSKGG